MFARIAGGKLRSGGGRFMTMPVRAGFLLITALGVLGLAGCNHSPCKVTAASSCSGTPGGGGGTGSTSAAFAFAVDEAGTIDGYALNATGGTFQATSGYTAPTVPTNQPGYGMVVAQTQYLYAAFAGTGQIFGWTIDSAGGLTTITESPFSAPYLIGGGTGSTESMIANPQGTLLFVEDIGAQGIYVYSIASGGGLTLVSGSPFSVPFFPGNMATDGLGKYLYVATETSGNEIAAYSIASSSGALTAIPSSPFAYAMYQVQGDPSGNYLIGTTNTSGDQHLYLFSITQSGTNEGAITQVQKVSTVYSPSSIAVQTNPGGNLVYSFSMNSDDTGFNPIEGYQLSNGTLTALSDSPFSNVSDGLWAQFDQSGSYLFPYSEVYNPGTGFTTIQLEVDDVSSGGALTQPISAVTLATPGVWAVTDAP
jgi:6-phosphogluconolactonase (cycloisomerase 2 family)